jgi:methyl-accepting chemotaxis protein
MERATQIDTLISEIARSSQEQSTGLGQVNSAVGQMDQMTQQNAAMVEETTAAAAHLRQQAVALAASVARFKLGDKAGAPPAAEAPANPVHAQQQRLRAASGGGGWTEF